MEREERGVVSSEIRPSQHSSLQSDLPPIPHRDRGSKNANSSQWEHSSDYRDHGHRRDRDRSRERERKKDRKKDRHHHKPHSQHDRDRDHSRRSHSTERKKHHRDREKETDRESGYSSEKDRAYSSHREGKHSRDRSHDRSQERDRERSRERERRRKSSWDKGDEAEIESEGQQHRKRSDPSPQLEAPITLLEEGQEPSRTCSPDNSISANNKDAWENKGREVTDKNHETLGTLGARQNDNDSDGENMQISSDEGEILESHAEEAQEQNLKQPEKECSSRIEKEPSESHIESPSLQPRSLPADIESPPLFSLPIFENPVKDVEPVFENEQTAWDSLVGYLADKGIPKEKVEGWTVKVQRRGGGHVSTIYFNPEGKQYRTRADIRRELQTLAHPPLEITREQAYAAARQHYHLTLGPAELDEDNKDTYNAEAVELPIRLGDLTVYELGTIHQGRHFHSEKAIYPVGFRAHRVEYCERLSKGVKVMTWIEKGNDEGTEDGQPIFHIQIDGLKDSDVQAFTPAEAWQQAHALMSFSDRPTQALPPEYHSFFNLGVERLLEGLPGAIDLQNYVFHEQRGLGKLYFDENRPSRRRKMNMEEEMDKALKLKERDVLQKMSKEDKERLRELQKKEKDKEKESRRRQLEEQKEDKLKAKRVKDMEKEAQKQKRIEEINAKAEQKEKLKEKRERRTSRHKDYEKEAKKIKKELRVELRKRRGEAKERVLAVMDAEEAFGDKMSVRNRGFVPESQLPDPEKAPPNPCRASVLKSTIGSEKDWGALAGFLPVWNFLHAFSQPLGLQNRVTPLQFMDALLLLSKDQSSERLSPDVIKEAEIVTDRVYMALVQLALPDLVYTLGIVKEHETKGTDEDGGLPVNQLTWPELARQCLVMAIYREVWFDKAEEDITAWVRSNTGGTRTDKQTQGIILRGLFQLSEEEEHDIGVKGNEGQQHKYPASRIKSESDSDSSEESPRHEVHSSENNTVSIPVTSEIPLKDSENSVKQEAELIVADIKTEFLSNDGPLADLGLDLAASLKQDEHMVQADDFQAASIKNDDPMEQDKGEHYNVEPINHDNQTAQEDGSQEDGETDHPSVKAEEDDEEEDDENKDIDSLKRTLEGIVNDESKEPGYRACAAVLRALQSFEKEAFFFQRAATKWDLPDFYEVVVNPITFLQIAESLEKGRYGATVVEAFRMDVCLVFANCWCYSPEGEKPAQAALFLATVFERLMAHMPPTTAALGDQLPDFFLLDNFESACEKCEKPVSSLDLFTSCQRCHGRFHEKCLPGNPEERAEIRDEVEEWFCGQCLRHPGRAHLFPVGNSGGVEKWGRPAGLPLSLDLRYNKKVSAFLQEDRALDIMHRAIQILSRREGGFLPAVGSFAWTSEDRLVVLQALCHLATFSSAGRSFVAATEAATDRLLKLVTEDVQPLSLVFQESIQELGGEAGLDCLKLMCAQHGILSTEDDEVVSGRCMVCRETTYNEPDGTVLLCDGCGGEAHLVCLNLNEVPKSEWFCKCCQDQRAQSQVEKDKRTRGQKSQEEVKLTLEEEAALTESRKEHEEALVDYMVDVRLFRETGFWERGAPEEAQRDKPSKSMSPCGKCEGCKAPNCRKCAACVAARKVSGSSSKAACLDKRCEIIVAMEEKERIEEESYEPAPDRNVDVERDGPTCDYCGNTALALCSPLVKGQTREEALAHFAMFRGMEAVCTFDSGERRIVQVHLKLEGERKPATIPMPFWPIYDSECAEDITGPVVHACCAVLMTEARTASQQYSIRKLKQEAAAEAIRLSGMRTHPLGQDRGGRQYWRLPWDGGRLYVTSQPIEPSLTASEQGVVEKNKWTCYETFEDLQTLLQYLHPMGQKEGPLLSALQLHFKETLKKAKRRTEQEATPSKQNNQKSATHPDILQSQQSSKEITQSECTAQELASSEHAHKAMGQHSDNSESDEEDLQHEKEARTNHLEQIADKIMLMQHVSESVVPTPEVTADFEDASEETTQDGFFSFKRGGPYYAAAIVDKDENILKLQKAQLAFEIYKGQELVNSEICSKPWNDGIYYFAQVIFKRSGRFRLKFLLRPGTVLDKTLSLKPDVYEVTVRPSYAKTGACAALNRLQAREATELRNRALEIKLPCEWETDAGIDEVSALKNALMTVASALPRGALLIPEGTATTGSGSDSIKRELGERAQTFVRPRCSDHWWQQVPREWLPGFEQIWADKLVCAQTCEQVLELLFVLEGSLDPDWLSHSYKSIMHHMPSIEQCLRVGTPAVAAVRIYVLDKYMNYKKLVNPSFPRSKQLALHKEQELAEKLIPSNSRVTRGQIASAVAKIESQNAKPKGRSTRTSQAAAGLRMGGTSSRNMGSRRSSRGAYSGSSDSEEDSDKDSEFSDDNKRRDSGIRSTRSSKIQNNVDDEWMCNQCRTLNMECLRRCETCNALRPARRSEPINRGRSGNGSRRGAKKRRRSWENSDSEDEKNEQSEDGDSSSNLSTPYKTRQSQRRGFGSSGRRQNNQDNSEEDEDDMSSRNSRDTRNGKQTKSPKDRQNMAPDSDQQVPMMDSKEFQLRCFYVLRAIYSNEVAEPFREPVDTSVYRDYRKYVPQPMDLQTVAQGLRKGIYNSEKLGFINHVRQIWSNCYKFNGKKHDISKDASRLSDLAENGWKTHVLSERRTHLQDLYCEDCFDNYFNKNQTVHLTACPDCTDLLENPRSQLSKSSRNIFSQSDSESDSRHQKAEHRTKKKVNYKEREGGTDEAESASSYADDQVSKRVKRTKSTSPSSDDNNSD